MRTLWLTNVPAYYRQGIWNNLASETSFTLVFADGLAHFDKEDIEWLNWKVMFSPLQLFRSPGKQWSDLRKELALQDLVVICGWHKWYYIFALIYCKKHRINSIVFYESIPSTHRYDNFLIRKLRSKILQMGSYVLAPSSQVYENLRRHKLDNSKIITCFNPIDVERISQFASENRASFDSYEHSFLYVGQLIPRKNILNLIEAFSDSQFENDGLTIVGSGELEEEIQALCNELKIENRVNVLPHSSEKTILMMLAQHQTLVLPSTEEVWGMVVAEALSAKIGVVVSENCGITQSIKDLEGVQVCTPEASSIQLSMLRAKKDWRGPYEKRNLVKFSPEHFSRTLINVASKSNRFQFETLASKVNNSYKADQKTQSGSWIWITNIPSSYRVAIWKKLAESVELQVYCIRQNLRLNNKTAQEISGFVKINRYTLFARLKFTLEYLKRGFSAEFIVLGGWNQISYILLILLRSLLRKKTIIHYGSNSRTHSRYNFLLKPIRIALLKQATLIIAYSDSSARSLVIDGLPNRKVRVFFNPVDSKYINQTVKQLRKDREKINGHKFLFVGQLIERKGLTKLLNAFHEMRNSNDRLKIVGDGKLESKISNLVVDLGLAESVELVGHKDFTSLLDIYSEHQTLVLPSSREVWGLVVNEALAAQLNVVVSRNCGVSESLEGLKSAFVYGDSAEGLVVAMRSARDSWVDWRDEEFFLLNDTDKFASDLIELYKDLANQ